MATTFKNILSTDMATTRTLLHEAIPITGTIVSGTYEDKNIKYYAHGMFESVYDYPYLSSSANRIFDLTYGYSSGLSAPANPQNDEKLNIYSEMSLVLMGTDGTGSIQEFDRDGDIVGGGEKMNACIFICYARLLTKDEIKKGSYTFSFIDGSLGLKTLGDYGAQTDYRVNSPAGEYGLLYTSSVGPDYGDPVGHLYYQAGIAVITASDGIWPNASQSAWIDTNSITGACDDVRNMWVDNNLQNTTELNSTIYFCRADSGEFNYSSNDTYLTQSKIIVKNDDASANPQSYITTIGLYSADNELLATAKLSEPVEKNPTNSLIFRVRLDY
jgi:hypothetical protein